MVANFNNISGSSDSHLRGYTANGAETYVSTDNPLLDFFFHVVPDSPHETVAQRLESAWKHDALKALKLVCNLRGVRGTGKSDKEGFYAAALWLHKNHPKTLAVNLRAMADFGYFKDLPELLFRLHEGVEIRKERKNEWQTEKYNYPVDPVTRKRVRRDPNQNVTANRRNPMKNKAGLRRNPIQKKVKADSDDEEEKPKKKKSRKEKAIELSKRALERYGKDTEYKNLHDKVSDVFADFLISDLKYLNSGETGKISLASKWCPSLDSCFDKATLLCESIARRIFPRSSNPDYENIEEAHYAYRIRDRLRKEYLVPLRKVLELPEVYMSSKMWESLPYDRVASVAMRNYKKFFEEHDRLRFNEYLASVNKGEKKIAAGALLPHEIIGTLVDEEFLLDDEYLRRKDAEDCKVAELQWRRMVDDITKIGKLNDCLAICDVSGSMNGTPMDVSVALGLLVSEITQEPWKGHVITFSEYPELHKIVGDDLRSKTTSIKRMDWGESTDFQKVFDLILEVAENGKLKEDQMIKRLFVFSDMEFTESRLDAAANDWETDYQMIQNKFREKGYSVPEMVFWNLRDSTSTPVLGQQKGVALVSGFSKNMIKPFLDGKDLNEITPVGVMEKAISGEEYNQLVVVD
ncbi:uncharacterized protein LOC113327785 isoform X1 [Papaver somniferum]|uniref:uncharacterized protein LOC113327785 isoform X1 n=1 Tax=Papaver somniferum TaxID=3469 RepID=UPI000E70496B|nr:uncharacterized protein LOC113327785 isoform X1 [Papaver somniferum]